MTPWLTWQTVSRAPRRLLLGAVGAAFPVAMFTATLFFIDDAGRQMVPVVLQPVQIEMRALATSPTVDMPGVSRRLATVHGVSRVEPFASADVLVHAPGTPGQWTARLFAVRPSYLHEHPWLRAVSGHLHGGTLLDQSLRDTPGFGSASDLVISLPGDAPTVSLHTPVQGNLDLRQASTWFAVPYGAVQGDLVTLPRALVMDYSTFRRELLPVLRHWATKGGLPPFDPGSDQLSPVSLEAHVSVDHSAYPSDPRGAAAWSGRLRRTLERRGNGAVLVADNAVEPLMEAQTDATNARILFLLLGIPGVLVAGALGLAASSALAEAHRREEALLRLRGATRRQVVGVAAADAALAGLIGAALGLAVATAAVSLVLGRPVWSGVPTGRLVTWSALALAVGATATVIRLVRVSRAERRSEVVQERRLLEQRWTPLWRRYGLDVLAILTGVGILAVNVTAGGLRPNPVEGSVLALSFFVLLAPIALWVGLTLLGVRTLVGALARRAKPDRAESLATWAGASVRWFSRRPARTAAVLALGTLAVAFSTEVVTFTATYQAAKRADAQAAMGSDLRLTPGDPTYALPALGPDLAAVTPLRLVPARVGSDRKTILTIDLSSYPAATTVRPTILSGRGLDGLVKDPLGVVVSSEIARDFSVKTGDTLPLTVFPDDYENSTKLALHVVGVSQSFPPTAPFTEMAMSTAALPPAVVVSPDFYLAKVAPGASPDRIAATLVTGPLAQTFGVTTVAAGTPRGLTALNLSGLSTIESLGGVLVAAVGVAVLGAFLVVERRREFAILRTLGADSRQVTIPTAVEGGLAIAGSLLFGIPLGLLLGTLAVRVLGLFFTLPPPLLAVPVWTLVGLGALVVTASAAAMTVALRAVTRVRSAVVLREP